MSTSRHRCADHDIVGVRPALQQDLEHRKKTHEKSCAVSVAQRAERLGEMRIYIEPETPATVGLHGGARANSR